MNRLRFACLAIAGLMGSAPASATDLVTLSPQSWDAYAPTGKEADAIYGDFVLRNDRVTAVIARPIRFRNANMMVRHVGGMIIDLARRDDGGGDQLQALWVSDSNDEFQFAGIDVDDPEVYDIERFEIEGSNQTRPQVVVKARSITLKLTTKPNPDRPRIELSYTLTDDADAVRVETTWINETDRVLEVEPTDILRAERTFDKAPNGSSRFFWVEDKWFGQAYGVVPAEVGSGGRPTIEAATNGYLSRLGYAIEGETTSRLEPQERVTIARWVFPAADLFGLRAVQAELENRTLIPASLTVTTDTTPSRPVAEADVTLEADGAFFGHGRTDSDGRILAMIPQANDYRVEVVAPWGASTTTIEEGATGYRARVSAPATVEARITDADGGPTPCKVQFIGANGTESPDFGPDTGVHAVGNLYYSENGRFEVDLAPGDYDVIISYGPEHDAVFTDLSLEKGRRATLTARLERTVDTTGWVSSDFHSHSSPSGDNSTSQRGRVLNLLCEQIDFAPCTEHNRLSTYVPHLKALGVEDKMATCTGIELTSVPGTVNHQNAFPLTLRPHTQDGGAPMIDLDPEIQIERLALWDSYSDKLIQLNHPDLGQVFFDRNGDGEPDQGFRGMFGHIDVIEVHPPHRIFEPAQIERNERVDNNDIVNWLQLLNQGHRYPGVVNTDAHYNLHGSGWLRNYLKSPTDDPSEIQVEEMVRAAENGHLVMSNGPFLEVEVRANGETAIPGDEIVAEGGSAELSVRIQCPNWFDIDRVQVFLNGRPIEDLNFTQAKAPEEFGEGPVVFERTVPLTLDEDTHVIVATIGEESKLGPVVGPSHAEDKPVAVSNPVRIDLEGDGFDANGDTLGAPLPTKAN